MTKDWWSHFSKDERRFIVSFLQNKKGRMSFFVPDGYTSCGICGCPSRYSPCSECVEEFKSLVENKGLRVPNF